jgi:predicted phosphoribosyltransferase
MRYRNRAAAGRRLGEELRDRYGDRAERWLVLGVARGGVPVAAEVASLLDADLDVAVAHKLGAPGNPEFAIGAVVEGAAPVIDAKLIARLGIPDAYVDRETERQIAEIERRSAVFRGDRAPFAIAGRHVIVIDDGVATGATLVAVLRAMRAAGAQEVICAVPVGPPDTLRRLAGECDAVVCPLQPGSFFAVGGWYDDFSQVGDREVVAALQRPDT